MSISTPSGISYKVHGLYTSNKNAEIPHVHVIYQGRSASISLKDVSYLIGADSFEQYKNIKLGFWKFIYSPERMGYYKRKKDIISANNFLSVNFLVRTLSFIIIVFYHFL